MSIPWDSWLLEYTASVVWGSVIWCPRIYASVTWSYWLFSQKCALNWIERLCHPVLSDLLLYAVSPSGCVLTDCMSSRFEWSVIMMSLLFSSVKSGSTPVNDLLRIMSIFFSILWISDNSLKSHVKQWFKDSNKHGTGNSGQFSHGCDFFRWNSNDGQQIVRIR